MTQTEIDQLATKDLIYVLTRCVAALDDIAEHTGAISENLADLLELQLEDTEQDDEEAEDEPTSISLTEEEKAEHNAAVSKFLEAHASPQGAVLGDFIVQMKAKGVPPAMEAQITAVILNYSLDMMRLLDSAGFSHKEKMEIFRTFPTPETA